jgi:hypothetical protein
MATKKMTVRAGKTGGKASKPAPKASAKSAKAQPKSAKAAKPAAKGATKLAKAAKPAAKSPVRLAFKLDSRINLRKDVAWRMIEGEAVIVTPADSMMHSLNEVGTRIWQLLDGKRTIRDVATTLAAEFEVEGARAESDTLWFVECLAKKGLVETN